MSGKKESEEDKEPSGQKDASAPSAQPVKSEPTVEAKPEEPKADEEERLLDRNEELLSRLKYLQADFENLQKRVLRERQETIMNAQEGILRSLLPLLDDLDKGVELVKDGKEGLSLVRTKLLVILGENGLNEIPAKGQKFDPFLHEAVEYVNDSKLEDGTVKEVVRKGYRCNVRVLRPTLVVVVKNEGEKNA